MGLACVYSELGQVLRPTFAAVVLRGYCIDTAGNRICPAGEILLGVLALTYFHLNVK